MGDTVIRNFKRIILPNKKSNILCLLVLFLGLIFGAIFAQMIGLNDKTLVIDKIELFISNINNNLIDSVAVFKNSISINLIYVFLIWLLGMAILGIIFNLLLLFTKGFIFGFTMASFVVVYSYKGMILGILYLLLGQLLNIIAIFVLTIYSLKFAYLLLNVIFKEHSNISLKKFLKNYVIILGMAIIISIIASVGEAFILPAILKLIVKLYI